MHRVGAKVLNFRNLAIGTGVTATAGIGALVYALENALECAEPVAHAPTLPWSHEGFGRSFDAASIRRGYEVYKQVCAACHSMKFVSYRHLVNVCMTEEEAKAEAAEASYKDLNDEGQPIERPGVLNDKFPNPYPNKKAAAAANNGAAPPDLSNMALARHGGENYLFALLTGYMDSPAGVKVDEGKAYNPYFPGGIIAMPQQLFDDGIEYKDGTPATQSQQAKDVCTFIRWATQPEHDQRKKLAVRVAILIPLSAIYLVYWKRYVWTFLKSEKILWSSTKQRKPPTPPVNSER